MSKKLYPHTDIANLVEADLNHDDTFFKGGKGSGIKGHRTIKDMNFHQRMQPGGGGLDKKRGALKHFDQMYKDAIANNDPEAKEHYGKLRAEAQRAVIGQMSSAEKDAKIKENDAKINKGGEGSGVKGHTTAEQAKHEKMIPKYPSCAVFDSNEGMIKVGKKSDGSFYADVDGQFDMSADSYPEMEKKLAKLGAKYAGQDEF